ncbi:2-dehydropantoate 2-reductase [Rhodanobacter sp. C03]|uniref:2-dehydropantoate 2-reductase n=1 Tax=Rhodanobacter sp. C03 TaxID=1945858 RepID=UPI000985A0EA|nr:2-dehydropantoate 2-reductase [Rhodanobacter sp. C03]OOG57420.1 2-dehydropantoate 2-reductase [Rhodanobacter sp. C03]
MRILIVGAGAIGGYFGGRLLQHGRDVTFLVREARAEALARTGLVLRSATGDANLAAPPTVLARDLRRPYDLVLLSCKAYALEQVLADIAPAVGPHTSILPLLNGMRHLDLLDARFGAERVLGGQCVIAATLDVDGVVQHLNQSHSLTFGERDGSASGRMQTITQMLTAAAFDARPSQTILQDMWDKWMFLATLAGVTCLMRAPVGDIVAAPGGTAVMLGLLEECRAVAERSGHAPGEATLQRARGVLTEAGSSLTASMLRDLQQGHAIEADHVIGDMLVRAEHLHGEHVLLAAVYAHLKAYEAGRVRTSAA